MRCNPCKIRSNHTSTVQETCNKNQTTLTLGHLQLEHEMQNDLVTFAKYFFGFKTRNDLVTLYVMTYLHKTRNDFFLVVRVFKSSADVWFNLTSH